MSLRLRLLLVLAPVFALALIGADLGTYLALQSSLVSAVDTQLRAPQQQGMIEAYLEGRDFRGPGGGGPQELPQDSFGALYSAQGGLITSHTFVFGTLASTAAPDLPSHLPTNSPFTVHGTGGIAAYRVSVGPAVDGSGNTLVVAIPLDGVNSTLRQLLLLEISISGATILLMVIAVWILVRRGLQPLEWMGKTARSIVSSDLGMRLTPSTDATEVGRLGLAINAMLDHIERAFAERAASEQRLRDFVADTSHELRTPLTSMRGYADFIQMRPDMTTEDVRFSVQRIAEETKRMSILVDDLMLLARLDQGRPLERKPVDLALLVRDAGADARASDATRPVTVIVGEPVVIAGDEIRLRQAVGNVVRNALVHTPNGSRIEITLDCDGDASIVKVIDHGRGIPAHRRISVFERFHRADPENSRDQGGSGLGLSIAGAIVAAHSGDIRVAETPGGGATFVISLPRRAA
jgi:two-component system, OmpR family, sensor kinase